MASALQSNGRTGHLFIQCMPLKKLLEITIFSVGEIQCWRSTVTTVDPQRADLLRLKFYKFEKFFEGIIPNVHLHCHTKDIMVDHDP